MVGYLDGSTEGFSDRLEVIEGRGQRLRSEEERARIAAQVMETAPPAATIPARRVAASIELVIV